jgi:hypothetical protein
MKRKVRAKKPELDKRQLCILTYFEQTKAEYSKYAVSDVNPIWRAGVDEQAIYPRECYARALHYALGLRQSEGVFLVHGESVFSLGGHAWVELPDGLVFDAVFEQFYRHEAYYDKNIIMARAWYKFTSHAACVIAYNMPETDHDLIPCRWDTRLKLPWISGDPLTIDFAAAIRLFVAAGLRPKSSLRMLKKLKHPV